MMLNTKDEKRVTFTSENGSGRVTARELIHVLESAIKWLRTVDPNATMDWNVIKVALGQRLRLTFSNPKANGAIAYGMGELNALQREKKKDSVTPHVSEAVLESTKELGEVLGGKFKSLSISSSGSPTVKVTPELVRRVDALVKPVAIVRYEWTEIEGVMDQVTVDVGTEKSRFRIIHPLTSADITCTFDQDTIGLESVKKALPHRVSVYGKARLEKSGRIVSVEVKRLRQLRDADAFDPIEMSPTVDITGGLDSADYVERIRSGD